MHDIILRYGTNRLPVNVPRDTTVGQLRKNFGSALGLPESVYAVVDGDEVNDNYVPSAGSTVVFEKDACNKA